MLINLNNVGKSPDELQRFFEETLVAQAVMQHFKRIERADGCWEYGQIVGYSLNKDKEELTVNFENGSVCKYSCVSLGVDGMIIEED